MTNPEFDWDDVIVTKRPKQKELEASFLSDPDLDLGSRPDEEPETIIIESTGLTECQEQSCGAADAYQSVLAYDEMVKCYGTRGEFTFVDTPAAIKFRISGQDNYPTGPNALDNTTSWNINAQYNMVDFTNTPCAPCEAKFDNKQLDATFLNAATTSNVAFFPRAFENLGGTILYAGQKVNVKTIFGQMFYGRRNDGLFWDSPDPARHGLGYLRCLAYGASTPGGNEYTGFNTAGINAAMTQQIVVTLPNDPFAAVDLTSDSIDWMSSDNDGYPIQEDAVIELSAASAVECNFYRGDITGAYLCKLELDIQMAQDGETAEWYMYMETEHVKSGKKVRQKYSSTAYGLNGSMKISDPYEISFPGREWTINKPINAQGATAVYNTRGGMEATTRYWAQNANVKRSMWLIAYDGWENEDKVRKACWEMERSRPSWQPKDYCSRIQ